MVGGGGRLVSQDQRNDHDVHVGLQQTHGGGVAEGMRRNPSALERGTMLQGLLDGSAQTFFHSPAGQRLAKAILKNQARRLGWKLRQCAFQLSGDGFEQWDNPLFASLAMQADGDGRSPMDILVTQLQGFRDARPV